MGRQPPISYIYRGGVTTLRTREWSLISSPSRHGVHRMHGLDGATGYRIERCRLCACTAQPLLRPKQLPGPPLASWTLTPFFQAVFATLSMMAAAITVRIHWRCAHVVQICLGDHHRLLSSSSWSTLATRMPGLVAIRVAVAAAVMNSRGSCHSGVALRVFFRARVCAASERCVVLCCSTRVLCVW